jgi:hypothetical protein
MDVTPGVRNARFIGESEVLPSRLVRELRRNSDMIEFLILYLQKSFIYSYLLVCILACFGRPKHLGPAQRARCDKRPEVRRLPAELTRSPFRR